MKSLPILLHAIKTDTASPPVPAAFGKWVNVAGFVFLWPFVAVRVLPALTTNPTLLMIAELAWLCFCGGLLLYGLSWFRIELTNSGVTRHGYQKDAFIAWSDAHVSGKGYLIAIASADHVIRINPLVYANPAEVLAFIEQRTTRRAAG